MCDRRQYGRWALAALKKRGCQSPRMIRGASLSFQLGYEVIVLSINAKTRFGSLFTFTSMLNLTCSYSGFISRATVSANVGMACLGFLTVRTCTIPLGPYQSLSRICPFESVVRSRLGSWNMTRTPSRETWTSTEAVTGHRQHSYGTKYRSRSLRRRRGLQLRNWLVYFRDMLQKHRGDPNIQATQVSQLKTCYDKGRI